MAKALWSLLVLAAISIANIQLTATSREEALSLAIGVKVIADRKAPAEVLESAKTEAARIYSNLGIELLWYDEFAASNAEFVVRVIDKPIKEAGVFALGAAPRNADGAGTVLFAFFSRIEGFARLHDKPVAQILGHVIAHEMGHLLLPHGSHSKGGIMTAGWDRAQVEQIGRGWLSFTPQQREDIRRKVITLELNRAFQPHYCGQSGLPPA